MALTTATGAGARACSILYSNTEKTPNTQLPNRLQIIPLSTRRTLHIVSAKKFSSRTGRFDSKNKKTTVTTKEQQNELLESKIERVGPEESKLENFGADGAASAASDGYVLPDLPGNQPDFWEGPQWDTFGFVIEYLWAFGIVFSVIAVGIAVATYNEGASDFKKTPAYQESVESRDLLEEPDSSSTDVFESNPTEVAPGLE